MFKNKLFIYFNHLEIHQLPTEIKVNQLHVFIVSHLSWTGAKNELKVFSSFEHKRSLRWICVSELSTAQERPFRSLSWPKEDCRRITSGMADTDFFFQIFPVYLTKFLEELLAHFLLSKIYIYLTNFLYSSFLEIFCYGIYLLKFYKNEKWNENH